MTRFRNATLPFAFAASIAVHVSTFAALVGVDGGPRAAARPAAPRPSPALVARLVAPAPAVAPLLGPPPVPPATLALPEAPAAVPTVDRSVAKPSPGATAGEANPLGWKPRIVVNDRVPRARFGEALEGDALAAFLTEVDAGVALPQRLDVPYPPAALAARKEGTVLAWAVIDDQGRVDDVHVVEGDPEFAASVDAALRATRFGPARNLGQNVPFYVTLEFEFRLDAAGGTVAAERARAAAR